MRKVFKLQDACNGTPEAAEHSEGQGTGCFLVWKPRVGAHEAGEEKALGSSCSQCL